MFTSSTAVYAQADGEWVDERSPTLPTAFNGRRLLEAEQLLFAHAPGGVVLRLGGIYGPGRTRLLERVRRGEASYPPGTPAWSNRIHRDDCAGALAHLLELPDPEPVYLGVDNEPTCRRTLLEWLAARLDAPAPRPDPALPPPRSNKRCSNARLCASGYRFRYPDFRRGYDASLTG